MMTAVLFPLLFNNLSDICPKVTLYNLLVDADGAVIKVYIIPSQGKGFRDTQTSIKTDHKRNMKAGIRRETVNDLLPFVQG